MKVMILGGYGVFGGRLVELLADCDGLTLLVCGRNLAKANQYCAAFAGAAAVVPIQLDRCNIAASLKDHRPDLVVDASGPFQDYGNDKYQVVEACIDTRVNYLDFADAADFVFGVSQFDARARAAHVFVLSGVSSFPVLTAAVLREIAKEMDIVSVRGGIAPSPYAGIGLNVMRAVVGYVGAPVKLLRGGKQSTGMGLGESMRYTIAPPGRMPLKNIHFSLVEVPDLQVIPPEYHTMTDIWMGAGPVPEILHRFLNILAKARALLRLPSLTPLSPVFYFVLNLMKFGEHRGGMFVHVHGTTDGRAAERSWHLLAEGNDGPYIPSMAIEAIIRKCIAGTFPATGARPATHALALTDYDALFEHRAISTGFRSELTSAPLFPKVLGEAFSKLPPTVQALHDSSKPRRWQGLAQVTRGNGLVAQLICKLIGFPRSASNVPVAVELKPEGAAERWTRTFGDYKFNSVQSCGSGRDEQLVVERFGVARFSLALVVEGARLLFVPRRWSLFGLPMPKALLPQGMSFETELDGRFHFDITVIVPGIGLVIAYRGWLEQSTRDALG
jgi:hypothetical protein